MSSPSPLLQERSTHGLSPLACQEQGRLPLLRVVLLSWSALTSDLPDLGAGLGSLIGSGAGETALASRPAGLFSAIATSWAWLAPLVNGPLSDTSSATAATQANVSGAGAEPALHALPSHLLRLARTDRVIRDHEAVPSSKVVVYGEQAPTM